jgi:hypothetical protein
MTAMILNENDKNYKLSKGNIVCDSEPCRLQPDQSTSTRTESFLAVCSKLFLSLLMMKCNECCASMTLSAECRGLLYMARASLPSSTGHLTGISTGQRLSKNQLHCTWLVQGLVMAVVELRWGSTKGSVVKFTDWSLSHAIVIVDKVQSQITDHYRCRQVYHDSCHASDRGLT